MNYKVRCPPNCTCGAHKDFRGGGHRENQRKRKYKQDLANITEIIKNKSAKEALYIISDFMKEYPPVPQTYKGGGYSNNYYGGASYEFDIDKLFKIANKFKKNQKNESKSFFGGGFLDKLHEMKEKMPPINLREFTEGAQRGGILGKYVNKYKGGGFLDQLQEMKEKYPDLAINLRGLGGARPTVLKPGDPNYPKDPYPNLYTNPKDFAQVIYPEHKGGGVLDQLQEMLKSGKIKFTTPGEAVRTVPEDSFRNKPLTLIPGYGKQFAESFKWMKKK